MTVWLDRADGVAWVRLEEPATRNALTPEDFDRLAAVFDEVERTPADRALVITGAGAAFCAGADLSDIRDDVPALALMRRIHEAAWRLHRLSTPSIAAVNGRRRRGRQSRPRL
jgi:2-(1,2-epoxy-1,2-dihydrophenyl)acetyl-CoA isomerase